LLALTLIGSAALAAQTGQQGIQQAQQVQTEQQTQNQGQEQQIRTEQQAQIREEAGPFILEAPERAVNTIQAREMIQQREQEMAQEVETLSGVQQKVYQNQNKAREAIHALLAIEDLAPGIGPQVSVIAQEFNNSVQATIVAEEKIQKRNTFVRFFMGGEKEAAQEMKQEINQNQERVQELKQLREDCVACNEEVRTMMQEQIQKMEQEQARLQELAERENNSQGVFGWVKNLFRWGR